MKVHNCQSIHLRTLSLELIISFSLVWSDHLARAKARPPTPHIMLSAEFHDSGYTRDDDYVPGVFIHAPRFSHPCHVTFPPTLPLGQSTTTTTTTVVTRSANGTITHSTSLINVVDGRGARWDWERRCLFGLCLLLSSAATFAFITIFDLYFVWFCEITTVNQHLNFKLIRKDCASAVLIPRQIGNQRVALRAGQVEHRKSYIIAGGERLEPEQ